MLSWSGVEQVHPVDVAQALPGDLVAALDDHQHVLAVGQVGRARCTAAFVDGVSPSTSAVTTWTRPLRARSDSAPRSAAAFIFLGVRWL